MRSHRAGGRRRAFPYHDITLHRDCWESGRRSDCSFSPAFCSAERLGNTETCCSFSSLGNNYEWEKGFRRRLLHYADGANLYPLTCWRSVRDSFRLYASGSRLFLDTRSESFLDKFGQPGLGRAFGVEVADSPRLGATFRLPDACLLDKMDHFLTYGLFLAAARLAPEVVRGVVASPEPR